MAEARIALKLFIERQQQQQQKRQTNFLFKNKHYACLLCMGKGTKPKWDMKTWNFEENKTKNTGHLRQGFVAPDFFSQEIADNVGTYKKISLCRSIFHLNMGWMLSIEFRAYNIIFGKSDPNYDSEDIRFMKS